MGCKKDNACKESRSEAAVHFVPPIYSDGRAITLVGQAQSLLADSRRATIKRIGGLQPCNLDLCQYAFKDRRKGVRGGPRALQGISVDTRLSRQRSILSNEGFEIAMPRAWEKLHPLVSDTLEGRAGSSGTFANHSGPRPSAPTNARLDAARDHTGTESREPPTYQRTKAANRIDQPILNQICSPVVPASSEGLSSINNIGGRRRRSILHNGGRRGGFAGHPGGQHGGSVGQPALLTHTPLTRRIPTPHAWATCVTRPSGTSRFGSGMACAELASVRAKASAISLIIGFSC